MSKVEGVNHERCSTGQRGQGDEVHIQGDVKLQISTKCAHQKQAIQKEEEKVRMICGRTCSKEDYLGYGALDWNGIQIAERGSERCDARNEIAENVEGRAKKADWTLEDRARKVESTEMETLARGITLAISKITNPMAVWQKAVGTPSRTSPRTKKYWLRTIFSVDRSPTRKRSSWRKGKRVCSMPKMSSWGACALPTWMHTIRIIRTSGLSYSKCTANITVGSRKRSLHFALRQYFSTCRVSLVGRMLTHLERTQRGMVDMVRKKICPGR